MRQFACKVRLNGSLYNEVPKTEVTIPEILILRVIHGGEAVTDLHEMAQVKRTDAEERDRLANIYGAAIKNRAEIVGGLGALIGFAGALPDNAPGIPLAGKAAKAKAEKTETETVEETVVEDAEE